MTSAQKAVQDFHLRAGATIAESPELPSMSDQLLRIRLIKEELDELDAAFASADLVSVADAIGDLLYVVLGTAVTCGIQIEPIFKEIHRSNMTKFIDGHRDEGGKWIKGPSYQSANIKPILDRQSYEEPTKMSN